MTNSLWIIVLDGPGEFHLLVVSVLLESPSEAVTLSTLHGSRHFADRKIADTYLNAVDENLNINTVREDHLLGDDWFTEHYKRNAERVSSLASTYSFWG